MYTITKPLCYTPYIHIMVHVNYTSFLKKHKEDQMRYLLLFGYFICGSTKENRSGPWLVKTSHKSSS